MKTINLDTTQLQRQLESIGRCDSIFTAIVNIVIYTLFGSLFLGLACCFYANLPGGIGAFFYGLLIISLFIAIGCFASFGAFQIIDNVLFKRRNRVRTALGLQPYRRSGGIR